MSGSLERENLPNVFLIGAQRASTTFLHTLLSRHPDIHTPGHVQEIHFFDMDENYARGLSWLAEQFAECNDAPVRLQTSPLYLFHPLAAQRIREDIPEARFITILRDPIRRACSHHNHIVYHGLEVFGFEAAVRLEPRRLRRSYNHWRHYSYVERGFYWVQLERYLVHFRPDRLLVLLHEELIADPLTAMRRCARFLEIDEISDDFDTVAPTNRHPVPVSRLVQYGTAKLRSAFPRVADTISQMNLRHGSYAAPTPQMTVRLRDRYEPDIGKLQKEFGLDLSSWLA